VGVLAGAALAALIAWMYLLVAHGGYWRADQRLPAGADPAVWPAVQAVVPARDEAGVVASTLPGLLAQG
jgi:hypothetical protein